jgi:hypothetical protein
MTAKEKRAERAARADGIQKARGCPYCFDPEFSGLLPAENGIHRDIHTKRCGVACKEVR